jgi:LAGLIDADG endonuclease
MASPAHPSVADLAWAAGFIDGEGCIHIAKQRYAGKRAVTYRLGVSIAQNDRPALEALREAVGIHAPIFETKRAHNHSRQCYTLNFCGRDALRLLALVGQYLRRKRLEAETAFRFWVEGGIGLGRRGKRVAPEFTAVREHYYLLMKRLK